MGRSRHKCQHPCRCQRHQHCGRSSSTDFSGLDVACRGPTQLPKPAPCSPPRTSPRPRRGRGNRYQDAPKAHLQASGAVHRPRWRYDLNRAAARFEVRRLAPEAEKRERGKGKETDPALPCGQVSRAPSSPKPMSPPGARGDGADQSTRHPPSQQGQEAGRWLPPGSRCPPPAARPPCCRGASPGPARAGSLSRAGRHGGGQTWRGGAGRGQLKDAPASPARRGAARGGPRGSRLHVARPAGEAPVRGAGADTRDWPDPHLPGTCGSCSRAEVNPPPPGRELPTRAAPGRAMHPRGAAGKQEPGPCDAPPGLQHPGPAPASWEWEEAVQTPGISGRPHSGNLPQFTPARLPPSLLLLASAAQERGQSSQPQAETPALSRVGERKGEAEK